MELMRILRSPDTGSGGGDAPPPETTTGNGAGGDSQTRTFTQAELDTLMAERATRAQSAAIKKLLGDIGAESPETVKEALAELAALKEAQLSDQEKAQKRLADLEAELEQERKAKADQVADMTERLLKAAVVNEATKAGFTDPNDAWGFLDRSKVKAADGGEFEGIDKAVEEIAKAKPYLLKTSSNGLAPGTPRRETVRTPVTPAPAQKPAGPIVRL